MTMIEDQNNISPLPDASIDSASLSLSKGGGSRGVGVQVDCPKCDEYLTGWKRALADYDNLKKDLAKERTAIREGTKELLAYDLVQTVDHFDQALKHKPDGLSPEVEKWLTGILHVRQQFESVLKHLGLESFGEVGILFDSAICEAVGEKNDESA
ncbi:MAG: nucleotide exchange factor GrpE, partial [Patescibacteria group bacterium]